jgi:hypothetical protein
VSRADVAFLVTGTPGAGKTTAARLLAGRFPRGAHIEADSLHQMIVSGRLWPDDGSRDEARGCKRVGERWAHLDAEQRAKLAGHGLWLDTSEPTGEETVDAILAGTRGRAAEPPSC